MKKSSKRPYTLIHPKSFKAYVRRGTLREVLCALIVQPEEAEDIAEEYGFSATPHAMKDFELAGGSKAVSAALQTIAEWTMRQSGADVAIVQITQWNRRLGVWCACQTSKMLLGEVSSDVEPFKELISLIEGWVVGRVGRLDLQVAASRFNESTYNYESSFDLYARDAVVNAAFAGSYRDEEYADASTKQSVAAAAMAPLDRLDGSVKWNREFAERLAYLRRFIANACLTFPG